jgi:hypothetical protein
LLKPTRIAHAQTESVSDASRLLDPDGLAVKRVESDAFGGRVVHVVTADETASACPSCGVFSMSVKGLMCTRPRDIPYGTTRLRLSRHKRRWRCKERPCQLVGLLVVGAGLLFAALGVPAGRRADRRVGRTRGGFSQRGVRPLPGCELYLLQRRWAPQH